MPYIRAKARRVSIQAGDCPQTAGELNFAISDLVERFVYRHGLNYEICNTVVGALENAKHEFQRRIQDPYEERAIQRNGDIYERLVEALANLC